MSGKLTLIAAQPAIREFTLDDLASLEGAFVGSLEQHEIDGLDNAVEVGWAERSYEGGAGFMGLAKVRLTDAGRRALKEGTANDR